jgi:Ca-activated chloride channel homolog
MKTFFLIFAIISGTLFVANPDSGTITGTVQDKQNGKPIVNATVEVFQAGVFISKTQTDSKGLYTIQIPAGTYDLKFSAPGYSNMVQKGVTVSPSAKTTVSVKLSVEITEPEEVEADYNRVKTAKCESYAVGGSAVGAGYYSDEPYIEHNTESYDVINENIFKEVIGNPLSTFSVDVDRASYSNIRRFLTQNQKPPIDAVRIEEMINYFDYDYPQPTNGHPFSVTAESGECPWNKDHQLVLIGLKGENLNETQIPANNLVFLLDVSGSMSSPNKLPLVIQSFKMLVEQLRPQDRVAIVVYAGAAGLVLESTPGNEKGKNHCIS